MFGDAYLKIVSGACGVMAGALSFVEKSANDVFVYSAGEEGGGFGGNLTVDGLLESVSECGGAFFYDVDLWEFPDGA